MGYFVIAKKYRYDYKDVYLHTYEVSSLEEGILEHIIYMGYLDDDMYDEGIEDGENAVRFVKEYIKNNFTDEEEALEILLERSEAVAEYKFLG